MTTNALSSCVLCLALLGLGAQSAAQPAPSFIRTTEAHRQQYLADAVIWEDRAVPSPAELLQGPPGRYPLAGITANAAGEIPCTYERGGSGLGGRTAKFTCKTAEGRSIRVKYYNGDPKTGNREVFAEVAATRLFWALGFDADPMYPVVVRCAACPADPMTGGGPRATRRFVGVVEAFYEGVMIGTGPDIDQGWSFGELHRAINALPPSAHRAQQQAYFDAFSLLAAFVQHGDRKPSQQRLVCRSALDLSAGDIHPIELGDGGFSIPVLVERETATACGKTAVTIQDLGATFGEAGQFTFNVRSKIHLAGWAAKPVFTSRLARLKKLGDDPSACYAAIVNSGTAGPDGEDNPRIGEAGRRLLYERMAALSHEHVRAIFEAARVLELKEPHEWRDPRTNRQYSGLDAWVAAFEYKVAEMGRKVCPA